MQVRRSSRECVDYRRVTSKRRRTAWMALRRAGRKRSVDPGGRAHVVAMTPLRLADVLRFILRATSTTRCDRRERRRGRRSYRFRSRRRARSNGCDVASPSARRSSCRAQDRSPRRAARAHHAPYRRSDRLLTGLALHVFRKSRGVTRGTLRRRDGRASQVARGVDRRRARTTRASDRS